MLTVLTALLPPYFFFILFFFFLGVTSIAHILKSSVVLLEKVHEKGYFRPIIFQMPILKLQTVFFFCFFTSTLFVWSASEKPLPRMLLAANRKSRAHVLIEK